MNLTTSRRIILARHGRTEWNSSYRFQGRTNIPLSSEGKRQAELLSLRLSSWSPQVIYTSPLDRACYTAQEIASRSGLTPVVIPDLTEIDFGTWEGQSLKSLELEQSEEYSRWRNDPFFNPPYGGETWEEISQRLTHAVKIMLDSPFDRIVAVSHGGVIRALYAVILGLDPHHTWYMEVSNCSISGIEISSGHAYLSFMNDSMHITSGKLWGEGN